MNNMAGRKIAQIAEVRTCTRWCPLSVIYTG